MSDKMAFVLTTVIFILCLIVALVTLGFLGWGFVSIVNWITSK